MDDIFNTILLNCPWVEDNWINWFWSYFSYSLLFLEYVMYGISIWDHDVRIFIISIGLTLNSILIYAFQKIYLVGSPFPGCGDKFVMPSGFSQQISFFYIAYFGFIFLRDGLINSYRLHVITIWTIFTLYSLVYFPFATHFQILFGCILGMFFGSIYLIFSIYILFPYADSLLSIKNQIRTFI